jgi:hypothetical protein
MIGEGGFGFVYKAELPNGRIVAIKRAKKVIVLVFDLLFWVSPFIASNKIAVLVRVRWCRIFFFISVTILIRFLFAI